MKNTTEIGRKLEDEVANLYNQIDGVVKVQQNINISGIQVDVYVELMTNDGIINKYAIDAKNFKNNVPAEHVRKCAADFTTMKISHQIDQGIIIAAKGFTQDGDRTAKDVNIKLMTLSELKRRVLDFSPYLEKWIYNYEKTDLSKMIKYLPLSAKSVSNSNIGQLDKYLKNWLCEDGTHITLLGNYGTGKSTTLRHLMWIQAKEYLNAPENNRIPIFVELKGFKHAPKSRQLITDILVNEYGLKIDFAKFQVLNSKGKFLIILDGFDEMVDKVIDGTIQEHFNELSTLACENSKVVLSCRTHYFRNHEQVIDLHNEKADLYSSVEGRSGFKILFLNSFKEKDIDNYLKAYFKADWESYKRTIISTYDLYSLAEIPILLNMIVETLPEIIQAGKTINRPAIYETFTNRWLKRDRWRTALHTDDRLYFCEQLALHFYTSQEYSVHWDALPRYITNYFGKRIKTPTDLDIFESDVRTSNFLKRKEDSGEYSFIHKSFMEYFVARYFHNNIIAKKVDGLDYLKDYTKSKVIYEFLLEMLTENDVNILKGNISIKNNKTKIYTTPNSIGNCAYFLINKGIDMKRAMLDTAIFKEFSLENISFEHASLGSATFEGCKIKDVSFKDSILGYANFENADLSNVDFSKSTLNKANFKNALIDSRTIESISKSKNWGSALFDLKVRAKIDNAYRANGKIEKYIE